MREGTLEVRRTEHGVLAVLRIQGHEFTAGCGYAEAYELGAEAGLWPIEGPGVGFSFASIARTIRNAASAVAKSRVLKSLASIARTLPSPIGDVARLADKAAAVIHGISKGDPRALQAWRESAATARAAPTSPTAVAMRLAMDAVGRPRFAQAPAPPPPPPPAPPPAADASSSGELADYLPPGGEP